MKRRRVVRVPASSANLGPGYDCSPRRCRFIWSWRWRRRASSSCTRTFRASPPTGPTCACALRAPSPGRRRHVPDPLRDPGGGGAWLERRGDRGRARRGRPHVRARRSSVRPGGRARGPSGQCRRGALWRLRHLSRGGRGAGALRAAAPDSRGCSRSREHVVPTAEARAAMPAEVPIGDACTTSATRPCSCSGSPGTTSA